MRIESDVVETGAEFSRDRLYRYRLWRRWADGPCLMVVGLNPSTADALNDDPTVRRCIGYARRWGFGGLRMLNLFALRSTDPKGLYQAADPLGPRNVAAIRREARTTIAADGAVLAAWGNHGQLGDHAQRIRVVLERTGVGAACLGLTKVGEPKHPLYLRADATPTPLLGDGGRLCR